MPPQCCRCNGNGRCKGCVCVRNGKACTNCTPSHAGRCENRATNAEPEDRDNTTNVNVSIPMNGQPVNPTATEGEIDDGGAAPLPDNQTSGMAAGMSRPDNQTPPIADTLADPLPSQNMDPKFTWGTCGGLEMYNAITKIYDEIIHWRQNLFLVPSGNAGSSFVQELARLLQAFADGSSMESVCMKAITILQVLVLQKPSRTSKSRDHTKHLKRRMDIWKAGNLEEILLEGRCIQEHLPKPSKRRDKSKLAKLFQNIVSRGKINKALRLLSNSSSGILGLDDMIPDQADGSLQRTTREILIEKHPAGKPAPAINLLQGHQGQANPILFENLNAEAIRKAAMKTNGAAGLSGLDAYAWRRLCSSFKSASKDLCTALAAVGRQLCTDNINPDHLSAFVACRLIPFNKCPGVRPIGIGEVPRRIIAKAILGLLKQDILDASGPLQVCAGQESGCEAAIHAMRQTFTDMDSGGALLIDASNAFNSMNRQAALHNISIICPSFAQVLCNTYKAPVRCVIQGEGEVSSSEGTTQGDPLAMAMYALAMKPLIDRLQSHCPTVKQVWYADDATGVASCNDLRAWWDSLLEHGKGFGYHPNASKTHLIVKEQCLENAKQQFAGTNVNITVEGKRHLGAAIGARKYTEQYVIDKVRTWTMEVNQLADIATSQPHAAYAAFVHGLSHRWTFLSRTIPEISNLFQPLEDAIHQMLIPALTGRPPCSILTRNLLALPVRLGGLGLVNPSTTSDLNFQASEKLTAPLVAIISSQDQTQGVDDAEISTMKKDLKASNRQRSEEEANIIYNQLMPQMKRQVDLAKERGASSWLSVLPLSDQGFHLHKGEFRDALCLRYGWTLPNTPNLCNCGKVFSADHAMVCHMGGFPTIRHNEIRDITASLLTEVCPNVAIEPCLQPLSGESLRLASANTADGARLDVRARGFWNVRQDTYFDVRVFHPNAPSNRTRSLSAVYKRHEDEKKRTYSQRVLDIEHGVFTPLVLSTTGGMAREAQTFYKRLADMLSRKRDLPYSSLMGWLRCKLSFAILRSAIMCIRGSRSSLHHPMRDATDIALACSEGHVPHLH